MKARLRALFPLAALSAIPAFGGLDDAFFDNTSLQEIRLAIDPVAWKTLRDNYLLDDYYAADFTWKSSTLGNVGIRSRGSGSRSRQKPNLTVKFNKYVKGQKLLGHDTVILKANNQDPSMLREILSMEIRQRLGMPAPREAPAKLYLNGVYFGLYTIVEAVDERFLDRVYGESKGYLYDFNPIPSYHFDYLGPDPAAYSLFELKTNEDKPDWATLIEMIRLINQAPDGDFLAQVDPYADLGGFLATIAVDNYVADEDGLLSDTFGMNNFYLYRPGEGMQSRFIRWDADFSFAWEQRNVLQNIDQNVFARRAFAIPALRQRYLDTMLQVATLVGGRDGWLAREIERLYALVGDAARSDPNKQCFINSQVTPCGAESFENDVNALRGFPQARLSNVLSSLAFIRTAVVPSIAVGGVVSAATSLPVLTPGSLAILYGSGLAGLGAEASATGFPMTLADDRLTVNGMVAPLQLVSPLQVNFQVPWGTTAGTATIVLSSRDGISKPVNVEVVRHSPGIYFGIHAADNALISDTRRVRPGEIIILYASGLGPVARPIPDGAPAPVNELAPTLDSATATISGTAATVSFAGLAPGMIGVYQVNLQVPEKLAGSTAALVLSVGGVNSPPFALPVQE